MRAFAEALEVIPSTLAENAGLSPIDIVTQLRGRHARGETAAGINVRRVRARSLLLFPCVLHMMRLALYRPFPLEPRLPPPAAAAAAAAAAA